MFGEGGNDLLKGNAHDDLVEGNQDGDWLEGNDDEDDLVGGSSFPDQPDTGDVLWGGQGADVLAGDNTCLVRQAAGVPFNPTSCEQLDTPAPTAFHYVTSQLGRGDAARRRAARPRRAGCHASSAPTSSTVARVSTSSSARTAPTSCSVTAAATSSSATDTRTSWSATGRSTAYGGIALPPEVGGTLPTLPPRAVGSARARRARASSWSGPAQADGQDDQMGGSNRAGHRDTGDWIFGDGEADFQLGDNGELNRTIEGDAYDVYEERYAGNTRARERGHRARRHPLRRGHHGGRGRLGCRPDVRRQRHEPADLAGRRRRRRQPVGPGRQRQAVRRGRATTTSSASSATTPCGVARARTPWSATAAACRPGSSRPTAATPATRWC